MSEHCNGSRNTLSLQYTRANGNKISAGVTKFSENDDFTFLDKSWGHDRIGSLAATADRKMGISGTVGHLGYEFRFGPKAGVKIEGYAGEAHAKLSADASVQVKTKQQTIHIPSVHVPAVPELGTPAYNFSGMTVQIPAYQKTLAEYHSDLSASSPYGGIRQSAGLGYQMSKKTMLIAGQAANIGFDTMHIGANLGAIFSTSSLNGAEAPLGDVCNGRLSAPADGFSFMTNLCVKKYVRHPLYDAEKEKAGEWVGKVNNRLSGIASSIYDKTGQTVVPPAYTAEQVLNALGMDNPYAGVHASLQLAASYKKGNLSGSVGVQLPLGAHAKYGPRASAAVSYIF